MNILDMPEASEDHSTMGSFHVKLLLDHSLIRRLAYQEQSSDY